MSKPNIIQWFLLLFQPKRSKIDVETSEVVVYRTLFGKGYEYDRYDRVTLSRGLSVPTKDLLMAVALFSDQDKVTFLAGFLKGRHGTDQKEIERLTKAAIVGMLETLD